MNPILNPEWVKAGPGCNVRHTLDAVPRQMPLHYAHCVKFTVGELDRAPFSKYEAREVTVDVEFIPAESLYPVSCYAVSLGGKRLACEDELEDALGLAAYELMARSRHLAGAGGQFLRAMRGEKP